VKAILVEGSGTNLRSSVESYLVITTIGNGPDKSTYSPKAGTVMAVKVSLTNHASRRELGSLARIADNARF
jgi:hypothetical protein